MATLTQYLRPRQKEIVKAQPFCTHAQKVTVWTHAMKKKNPRTLCVACWLHQSGAWQGFPLDRKRKKKEKHIPHYTWEGWAMESCPHVLFRRGLFHLESKWPACRLLSPQAYTLWLRASQWAEKERAERDIDVKASRGRMNRSSNNGASVTEVLSVC